MRWQVCAFLVWIVAVVGGASLSPAMRPAAALRATAIGAPPQSRIRTTIPTLPQRPNWAEDCFSIPSCRGARARSCGSCHYPSLSWGDGLPRAIGEGNAALPLGSPTLLAIAWIPRLGWDGKFRDLESVAFGPITSPTNMNLPEAALMKRLQAIPDYVSAFETAFGPDGITRRNVELALATFQRSIEVGQTPFDSWVEGDEQAISTAAKRGFELFNGKARCSGCHNGFAFSNGSFHDIGTATDPTLGAPGCFRPPSSCATHSRRRRRAMWPAARPTCTTALFPRWHGGVARPNRSVLITAMLGGLMMQPCAWIQAPKLEPQIMRTNSGHDAAVHMQWASYSSRTEPRGPWQPSYAHPVR